MKKVYNQKKRFICPKCGEKLRQVYSESIVFVPVYTYCKNCNHFGLISDAIVETDEKAPETAESQQILDAYNEHLEND